MKNTFFIIILCSFPFFISCKKEDNLTITFNNNLQNNSAVIDGRTVRLTKLRIFISNIQLIDQNNEIINVKDVILYELDKNNQIIYSNSKHQTITAIRFSIGLDSLQNSAPPSSFPASHPMSLEQDMHWGMIKYRFLTAEGVLDSSNAKNQEPNFPFSLHLGRDELFKTLIFKINSRIIAGNINIIFNYEKMFESGDTQLDPRNYFSIHSNLSEMEDAGRLMTNFTNGIEISDK
jgi:hypothetical protein